ncbi:TetR/AcrR family transcriptional regulator [Gordonia sp. TBRC 11910]|uniref:TetR/AcrR family transcriptional regulator n=1 Tax=Gordonia asplenii TaxID=2725283 RepID=A0A848KNU4_9ACTN|nr:TetR/AcrR family transcriptional regulator [Gordonia asplenii]NMN99959.1 TetR/AcrR family transcriptional regulator [Gordonia asplenii]
MKYVEASVRRPQLVAAAQVVLARDGVAGTALRAVAAEAGVSLGTVQHVFGSKAELLRAVIEDVVHGIAEVLDDAAHLGSGLEFAIRDGMTGFWDILVADEVNLQIMQYELTLYALREPGQAELARWQYQRYGEIVASWCENAARNAGETCAVPFDQLGRLIVSGIDGILIQYLVERDARRARADLAATIKMLVGLADVRLAPAPL